MFDKVIMNPPYNIGGKVWDETRNVSENIVCLMPLTQYKVNKRYKYIDYFADDLVVTCPDAVIPFIFDDKKADNLQWTFEDGTVDELTTGNRFLNQIKDINKWTMVLKNQAIAIENISTEANAPTGSTKALSVQTAGPSLNAHVTARIKASKLDLVPGKTYNISFWALHE